MSPQWRTCRLPCLLEQRLRQTPPYTFYEWEDELAEREQISLLVGRKRTSKRRDVLPLHDYKQWLRRRIETVFGEITKSFLKKIHATTLSGFILKISLFLFAYQVDKAFNNPQLELISSPR
jgi:hypothetical protein